MKYMVLKGLILSEAGGGIAWQGREKGQFKLQDVSILWRHNHILLEFFCTVGSISVKNVHPIWQWDISYHPLLLPLFPLVKDWHPKSSCTAPERESPWRTGPQGETQVRRSPNNDLTWWPLSKMFRFFWVASQWSLHCKIWVTKHHGCSGRLWMGASEGQQ